MKYLNMLMLSIAVVPGSLGLLNATSHDPVKNFATLIHSGAKNCTSIGLEFENTFKSAISTMTPAQIVPAFLQQVNGKDAISIAREIGNKTGSNNCLVYANSLEILKKQMYVASLNPKTRNSKIILIYA